MRSEKTLLFLCTGNYYRSRFAEILFNSIALKMNLPWKAISKGLALERGVNNVGPIATSARQTLEKMGIHAAGDCYTRMPVQATHADFESADRIIALKHAEHHPLLEERFPTWLEKVEFWHIDDAPEALNLIEQEVMTLVARLLGGGNREVAPPPEMPAKPAREPSKSKGTVRVGRETKGRRGKGVTTIFDVPLDESGLRDLAATLKQKCGTGGTVKEGRIEIQGDQRERIVAELEKLGYKVKRVGG